MQHPTQLGRMYFTSILLVVLTSTACLSKDNIMSIDLNTKLQDRFFPAGLLHADWQRFEASGYSKPVTGIIYRGKPRPTCGMPLGGLDTGCIDIETNGMLGYSTIFNELFNPRPILNVPFLGLSVNGKT